MSKELFVEIKLKNVIKIEDWYRDGGSTLKKKFRPGGKGRSPYTDSIVKFRVRIAVNGEQVFSNYPKDVYPVEEESKNESVAKEFAEKENMRNMTKEEKEKLL